MIQEIDIPRPLPIRPDKLGVPRRPFGLGITREHALDRNANALDVVHGAPALGVEQVEADDAVAIDVRVQGDLAVDGAGEGQEDDFGRLDGVGGGEEEAEAVVVSRRVDGVVGDGKVHLPFAEVWGGDEGDAGGEGALDLCLLSASVYVVGGMWIVRPCTYFCQLLL